MTGLRPYAMPGTRDAFDVARTEETFETPLSTYLGAQVVENFWSSTPGQVIAQGSVPSDDRRAVFSGRGPARTERTDVPLLSEVDWKGSRWHREGIEFDGRMTEARARAKADIFDENARRRFMIEKSPTGMRSILGFGAAVVGGAADPLNFVPIFGPAAKAAVAGRMALMGLRRGTANIATHALLEGSEAAIGATVAQPFLISSRQQFGDDVSLSDALLDITFAGVFGAAVGGTRGAWGAWRGHGAVDTVETRATGGALLNQAVGDLAAGRKVELPDLGQDIERMRQAVRTVEGNPIGDPRNPLVSLTTHDLQQVIVARGGFKSINELEISRHGWGLVKVLWEHGWKSGKEARLQISENDIIALPEILRTKRQIAHDRGPLVANWVVERDSAFGPRKVLYSAKRMDGAEHGTLVTAYVIDPKGPHANYPLSEDVAGGSAGGGMAGELPASQGDGSHAPKDTAAASAQPAKQGQVSPPAGLNIARAGGIASPQGQSQTVDQFWSRVAITSTGRRVPVGYEVVEAGDLITSHDADLNVNPLFPAALQPRDRGRAASAAQITDIAARLDPDLLGRTAAAGDGAPIIGPDNIVESGNGRTLAIRRAYAGAMPTATRYRAWLTEQGFDVAAMREPVLVRRRAGDLSAADRAAFAAEANDRSTLALGATERALSDARGFGEELFDAWTGGDVTAAGNRDFVRGWLGTMPAAERGALVDAQGRLSQDGARRLQAALLARAYDDPHLVNSLLEATDDNMRGIGKVLTELSPDWIKMRLAAAAGDIVPEMDQTAALMQAVGIIRKARDSGMKVGDLADQLDMFDPTVMEVRQFLQIFYGDTFGRAVGQDKVRTMLGRYLDQASMNVAGARLFGAPLGAGDLLAAARGVEPGANPRGGLDPTPAPEARPNPEIAEAAARSKQPGDIEDLARELGIDVNDGAFDELVVLAQIEARGAVRPDEAMALRAADAQASLADEFAAGLDAAALCSVGN